VTGQAVMHGGRLPNLAITQQAVYRSGRDAASVSISIDILQGILHFPLLLPTSE
jgi:hypothetical protein